MSPLDLNKLKKRTPLDTLKKPKKKIDRFDGLSEEEVQKHTLEDYLQMNLDIVFIGINPSLMAAYRGRYYAGPGNHFYKLLFESGLTPRFVSFEEDYKLLQYGIGLTNIVTRATRSAADLKRTEIKEGAKIVEEKLKLYKPKIAVFNGKGIYEVFANITNKSTFHFGLQPECINNTAIWVTPSSSARCANFPRLVDKLHFYTALKKYLYFLKGELTDIDMREFWFEGKCKQFVPSTSKMWRRKNISTFLQGGRIVNKNTLCRDTSEEDIAAVYAAEFLVEKTCRKKNIKNKDTSFNEEVYNQKNEKQVLFNETLKRTEEANARSKFIVDNVNDEIMMVQDSEDKKDLDISSISSSNCTVNNISNHGNTVKNSKTRKTPETIRNHLRDIDRDASLDFMSLIKQRLSEKKKHDILFQNKT